MDSLKPVATRSLSTWGELANSVLHLARFSSLAGEHVSLGPCIVETTNSYRWNACVKMMIQETHAW